MRGTTVFRELVSRLLRSRRVGFAVFGNGMFSLASFLLSISVARSSSIEVFGAFSLALVAYQFVSGFISSALTDTALSRPDDPATFTRAFQRASLLGVVAAVVLLAWGLLSGNAYIVVFGVSVHGLLLMDFLRMFDSAAGSATRAVVTTSAWSLTSLAISASSLFLAIDPVVVFTGWAVTGAICGYATMRAVGVPQLPGWERERPDSRAAVVFSADYLIGQGGIHLTTGLLGLLDDARVLGAVRGAGTLLGPMNLIATTAGSLMLPYLARDQQNPGRQLKSAVAAAGVQVVVLAPLLILLQFIPDSVGEQLLGDTWQYAAVAILPLSIDSILSVCTGVAISGHRVNFAGRRTLFLRIGLGIPRPLVILFSAYSWGIEGAAWSMALFALISAVSWWLSFHGLARRAARQPSYVK
ncbi:hypothetical protein [Corynebacterium halotolerans]|uniref:hypothetical protein n=1 Tax=Corynebacterium halotolerans TaxID=225326 RepID=UPI003CFA3AE6